MRTSIIIALGITTYLMSLYMAWAIIRAGDERKDEE